MTAARAIPWLGGLVLLLVASLALSLPRSVAYDALVEENLALKARLAVVERKVEEVDRILLRLQLYQAQLESLGTPEGPAGPVGGEVPAVPPPGAELAAADVDPADAPRALDGAGEEGPRPASAWAAGVEARVERILEVFGDVEPDLTVLVEELESLEALDRALPSRWPAEGPLTSGFGWRRDPVLRSVRRARPPWRHHAGIDLGGARGDPIFAAAPGTVTHAGPAGSYGRLVVVDHGFGVVTAYAHCARILVETGQHVRRGQQLALIGGSGRTTGPHLHFEVRIDGAAVDPLSYLPSRSILEVP